MTQYQQINGRLFLTQRLSFEAEVATGLEDIARQELIDIPGVKIYADRKQQPGAVKFSYQGNIDTLDTLQTVIAVYSVQYFEIPRPKALLGHENYQKLLQQMHLTLDAKPDSYHTLYLNAAGSDSSIMERIKHNLSEYAGLQVAQDEGDCLLRIRRVPDAGWETLFRLTPRPLATRDWRVRDMPGALNASVAQAMIRLLPDDTESVLNIGCGSGTLLIEHCQHQPDIAMIGCDNDPEALIITRQNIAVSGYTQNLSLLQCDARCLPLPDACLDALTADLPFGNLVGTHSDNETLYPAILSEAARVARSGAKAVFITHEVRLMNRILAEQTEWQVDDIIMITLSGLHPRIFLLTRQ